MLDALVVSRVTSRRVEHPNLPDFVGRSRVDLPTVTHGARVCRRALDATPRAPTIVKVRTVCAYSFWFPEAAAADEIWSETTAWITGWYAVNEPAVTLPAATEWAHTGCVVPDGHELTCAITALAGAPGPLRELS